MIKRYHEFEDGTFGESEFGDYVRYEDHLKEVEALRVKLETIESLFDKYESADENDIDIMLTYAELAKFIRSLSKGKAE